MAVLKRVVVEVTHWFTKINMIETNVFLYHLLNFNSTKFSYLHCAKLEMWCSSKFFWMLDNHLFRLFAMWHYLILANYQAYRDKDSPSNWPYFSTNWLHSCFKLWYCSTLILVQTVNILLHCMTATTITTWVHYWNGVTHFIPYSPRKLKEVLAAIAPYDLG